MKVRRPEPLDHWVDSTIDVELFGLVSPIGFCCCEDVAKYC
jgi:hypothetical protein